ncbi:MAG: hypothetical protein KDC44_10095, partial [Phaeodactylibacter sp.]|nr:hypothetical protein [Phaeodactylibacter sp.]
IVLLYSLLFLACRPSFKGNRSLIAEIDAQPLDHTVYKIKQDQGVASGFDTVGIKQLKKGQCIGGQRRNCPKHARAMGCLCCFL